MYRSLKNYIQQFHCMTKNEEHWNNRRIPTFQEETYRTHVEATSLLCQTVIVKTNVESSSKRKETSGVVTDLVCVRPSSYYSADTKAILVLQHFINNFVPFMEALIRQNCPDCI